MFTSPTSSSYAEKDSNLGKVPHPMKLWGNKIIKYLRTKYPSIGLKAHFIKQMVKEDFHSSKYGRAFKCDMGGGNRGEEGKEEKRRQGGNGKRVQCYHGKKIKKGGESV